MSVTKDEAIKQIEKLKSYCEYMADSDESGAYLFDLDGQALDLALSALRSITREQMEKAWKGEWVDCSNGWMCSRCEYDNTYAKPFCPNCGAPMTDEAVEIIMERLEGKT